MQFQDRQVTKTYVGAVSGVPDGEGVITGAIGKILTPEGYHRVALLSEAAGGRAASTKYRVLDTAEHSALLALAPRTGRAHQLRVHLAAIGHPLLGDALHGGAAHERLCLHSAKLAFAHPATEAPVAFASDAPFDATGGPPPR
jgi:tRNA pseudouridine32 synthase/23S rRNA pseudouridine746 synthase